jgi:uncharacterized zinc-type alcohol dehydrogenase-like protein
MGTMVLVGAPPAPVPVAAFALINGNKRLVGSSMGGIAETQKMLDYCAEHGIVSDIEVIPIQQINQPTSACSPTTCVIASSSTWPR